MLQLRRKEKEKQFPADEKEARKNRVVFVYGAGRWYRNK